MAAGAAPAAVVDRLTATVDYLRVCVGDDPEREWLPCAALVSDPELLLATVRPTAAERGTDRDDVAVSLFVQGYAFRIASVAIGSWVLADRVLDVGPGRTAVALGRGRPNAVRLDDAAFAGSSVTELHRHLVDGHLAALVESAHESCRIGRPLLWANVGASCASSFGALVAARQRVTDFFAAARPELAASGRVVEVDDGWAWKRAACCLWYQTASGFRCEDCSLW